MADHLFHVFEAGAGKQKIRAERVPKVMEVKILNPCDPAGFAPSPIKPINGLTIEMAENITRAIIRQSFPVPHPFLMGAPL